jgi:hypothetical protein
MPVDDDTPDVSRIFRSEDDDEAEGLLIDLEEIDLQALAEEIYALLRQELRLEYERQGRYYSW